MHEKLIASVIFNKNVFRIYKEYLIKNFGKEYIFQILFLCIQNQAFEIHFLIIKKKKEVFNNKMLKATLMVICLINLASGGKLIWIDLILNCKFSFICFSGVVKRETNATWTNIDKDTGAYCDLSAKESKLSCNGYFF